nr:transposase, MuDR, MULE transposase domain protein [Tanacetum cinerariifolium]
MHFLKALPFGLVSMYCKKRDRHCAYRPVASIGGRSLEPAAMIKRILKLYKNDSVRVRARCDGKVLVSAMSQGTKPSDLNREMENGPSGSSGPSTNEKKGRIQSTHLNTTVKIAVERNTNPSLPTRVFKRIYVCLGALKPGFRACKRELLGLDCAFIKGSFPGQVLVVVGVDSTNDIFPLAYALVEAETCWNIALNDRVAQPIEAWVGRPKKKRKRSKHEDELFVKDGKLSKKGRTITYQSCGNIGHNMATCKDRVKSFSKMILNLGEGVADCEEKESIVKDEAKRERSVVWFGMFLMFELVWKVYTASAAKIINIAGSCIYAAKTDLVYLVFRGQGGWLKT